MRASSTEQSKSPKESEIAKCCTRALAETRLTARVEILRNASGYPPNRCQTKAGMCLVETITLHIAVRKTEHVVVFRTAQAVWLLWTLPGQNRLASDPGNEARRDHHDRRKASTACLCVAQRNGSRGPVFLHCIFRKEINVSLPTSLCY